MREPHPLDWGKWTCQDCLAETHGQRNEPPAPGFCDCNGTHGELVFEEADE